MTKPNKPSRLRLGVVLEFLAVLWEMNHALATTSRRMKARFGVTGPQRLVLRIVGKSPGISAGHVAEILHLHPSTLTPILGRLEGRGLLARTRDPGDRRRVTMRLTRRGESLAESAIGEVEQAVERVLSNSGKAQVETTHEVLRRLTDSLGKKAR